jgi:Zn-finger nucleic acid-binding protein
MKCPRCKTELIAVGVERGRASGCQACGGLWLDQRATTDLLERKPASLAGGAAVTRPEHDESAILRCPECGGSLQKEETFYVQVDRCESHGVWFDRGELEFIARETAARAAQDARTPGQRYADQAERWGNALHALADHAEQTLRPRDDDDYYDDDDD